MFPCEDIAIWVRHGDDIKVLYMSRVRYRGVHISTKDVRLTNVSSRNDMVYGSALPPTRAWTRYNAVEVAIHCEPLSSPAGYIKRSGARAYLSGVLSSSDHEARLALSLRRSSPSRLLVCRYFQRVHLAPFSRVPDPRHRDQVRIEPGHLVHVILDFVQRVVLGVER